MSLPQFSSPDQCSECPNHGHVLPAEYAIEYTGPDPLDCGGDARRDFACRLHLADVYDYATSVNTGFSPVLVTSLESLGVAA